MRLSDWFGYPGESEVKSMELVADILQKSADNTHGLVTSVKASLELIDRLNKRVAAIEDILKQRGLAQ